MGILFDIILKNNRLLLYYAVNSTIILFLNVGDLWSYNILGKHDKLDSLASCVGIFTILCMAVVGNFKCKLGNKKLNVCKTRIACDLLTKWMLSLIYIVASCAILCPAYYAAHIPFEHLLAIISFSLGIMPLLCIPLTVYASKSVMVRQRYDMLISYTIPLVGYISSIFTMRECGLDSMLEAVMLYSGIAGTILFILILWKLNHSRLCID